MGLPTILDRSTQARAVWLANGTSDQAAGDASNPFIVGSRTYTHLGYQQLANATLAASTPMTVPAGATVALVQNNGAQPARFRIDGATTAPTASTGQRIASGGYLTLDIGNAQLTSTRFIREADGCTLDISYYS